MINGVETTTKILLASRRLDGTNSLYFQVILYPSQAGNDTSAKKTVTRSWLKPRLDVPKLPTVDQLHNDGKPAFPKWEKPKNPRMKDNKSRGLLKYVRGLNKCPGQSQIVTGTPKYLRGQHKYMRASIKWSHYVKKMFAHSIKCTGHT